MTSRERILVSGHHPGSALVVVLVVIVLLSLAAYSFTEMMVLQAEASGFAARQARARVCADSGVQYAAAILGADDGSVESVNLNHDPAAFARVPVLAGDASTSTGMFTIVAPDEADDDARQVRFGLIDESARLNLNAVNSFELVEDLARRMFLAIPGMSGEAADGILDWVDDDDEPRAFGAESDVYSACSPLDQRPRKPVPGSSGTAVERHHGSVEMD